MCPVQTFQGKGIRMMSKSTQARNKTGNKDVGVFSVWSSDMQHSVAVKKVLPAKSVIKASQNTHSNFIQWLQLF